MSILEERIESFIYLCSQHGVEIILNTANNEVKSKIIGIASEGLNDTELSSKCSSLALSVGLQLIDNKLLLKEDKKTKVISDL